MTKKTKQTIFYTKWQGFMISPILGFHPVHLKHHLLRIIFSLIWDVGYLFILFDAATLWSSSWNTSRGMKSCLVNFQDFHNYSCECFLEVQGALESIRNATVKKQYGTIHRFQKLAGRVIISYSDRLITSKHPLVNIDIGGIAAFFAM